MKRSYGQCLLLALGTMFLGSFTCADAHGRPAVLGNLTEVNHGTTQYRYQRAGNIGFDFVKRQKRFTLTEAIWIRDALDKLPAAYLQKADVRAALLGDIMAAFRRDSSIANLLLDEAFRDAIERLARVREVWIAGRKLLASL